MRENKWTKFMDMHSGGNLKEKQAYIYIEAPEKEARVIFYNRFGHSPDRVTCTCCGEDYSLSEYSSLKQATGYDRGCEYGDEEYLEKAREHRIYVPLEEYLKQTDVLVIYDKDIQNHERKGDVPKQGYVWQE